jgi:hypothetical protein
LREDLKNNGLKIPIVLYENKVLDGWHRHNICKEFNIAMRFENYTGDCPQLHSFSLNVARRHLQPPQLAALAVELLPSFEKDAKIRQLATLKQFANKTSVRGVKNGTTDGIVAADEKTKTGSQGKSRSLLSKQLGVSTGYIERAKKIKQEAPDLFEELKNGTKTFQDVKREIYQTTEAKLKDTSSVPLRQNDEQCSLHICDLANAAIEEGSLDVIITDPPYPKENLDCWKKLGAFAASKLKDGGVLLAMSGTYYLPQVMENLRTEGLNYYWMLAYHMPQLGAFPIGKKVHSHWKPVLWYVKGGYKRTFQNTDFYSDPYGNCAEGKKHHKWGQSVPFFTQLVENFTYADELVCDPFLGGGTTAIAALSLKRRFIGMDIDPIAIETSSKRILEWKAEPGCVDFSKLKDAEMSLAA